MSGSGAVAWLPPLVTLAIGLVAGGFLFVLARRSRALSVAAAKAPPLDERDLLARRDALVRQLQELEDTEIKRTPEQLARERYDLELETAQVLLALDAGAAAAQRTAARESARKATPAGRAAAAASAQSAGRADPARRAAVRGFTWGFGTATALLLLVFFAWRSANPREEGAPATGASPSMRGAAADVSAEEAQLAAAVERRPDDIEARLALARLKLVRRDLMGVWNETARILELAPGNPKALTYQAVVRLAMGQAAIAVDLLRKAVASEPDLVEAHAYLALAYARMGRTQDAESTVAAASRRFPQRAEEFQRLLGDSGRAEAGPELADDDSNPHAAVEGGSDSAAGSKPAAAKRGRHVAGTIILDPPLAGAVPPGAVLFVFVRAAGATEGPPVAVKRLAPVFPAAFDLSDADAMMGQPFPDPVLIEARLDEDGDPTTRPPTDPKARIDGVRAGRTDLRLVLKRP